MKADDVIHVANDVELRASDLVGLLDRVEGIPLSESEPAGKTGAIEVAWSEPSE